MLKRTTSIIAGALLLAACQTIPGVPSPSMTPDAHSTQTAPLSGHLVFSDRRVQATVGDIINAATVSLIDTATGTTVASGVSNASGEFTLTFPLNFSPPPTSLYILEAVKGLSNNRPGHPAVRIRTVVKYAGGWTSITNTIPNTGVVVNAATTALSIGAGLRGISDEAYTALIGAYDTVSGAYTPVTGLSASDFAILSLQIAQSLAQNRDPVANITAVGQSSTGLSLTFVKGQVYDEAGALVNSGAKVIVKSLNPSNPFESIVDVVNGNYVVNGVPAGVLVEVTVTREGWTQRTKVANLLPLGGVPEGNVIDFGGGSDPYFISGFPEITSVEPMEGASFVDGTRVMVRMTLSEPLDANSRTLFGEAVRIFPANAIAAGGGTNAFVDFRNVVTTSVTADAFAYSLKAGDVFLEDGSVPAMIMWDGTGRVATLLFNAPQQTGMNNQGRYQVALVAPGNSSQRITDWEGNQLGTDSTGSMLSYPAANTILSGVFKDPDLSMGVGDTTAVQRWLATHTVASSWEVASDNTPPQLTNAAVVKTIGETRIRLTFSEPMAAYGTTSSTNPTNLTSGAKLTFAVGTDATALSTVVLDGTPHVIVDANAAGSGVGSGGTYATEFGVAGGTLRVNAVDPRVVNLVIPNASFFANSVNSIKVRVEGVSDPAGNAIGTSAADTQITTGSIQ